MSDKMITVATYNQIVEAELAHNLLEREGIASIIAGETAASTLFGTPGSGILLQVQENDAQRAAGILAACAAEAATDPNWEEKAESGQDVWVCSICGEPVSNRLSVCYSCQTPRESIRASRMPQSNDVKQASATERPAEPPPTEQTRG